MSLSPLSIGLDVGDSTSLLLADAGTASSPLELHGPGGNPNRIGLDGTVQVVVDLVRKALRDRPTAESLTVCAGVAGAGREDEQERLATRLRTALSGGIRSVQVRVAHDASIALEAAFGAESGVVVIAGSGSVGVGRTTDGSVLRVGGWGYLLGDPASGYALGRAGLRAVAAAHEGGPDTALRTHVQQQFGIDGRESLIQTVYGEDVALQTVAPLVVDAAADGDPVADGILKDQTEELAQHVRWLIDRTPALRSRIALHGGMTNSDHYVHRLRQALHRDLPDWTITRLDTPPVLGALRMARRITH